MTREETIEVIKAYRDKLTNSASNQLDGDIEAFDKAIESLEQEPKTGHWSNSKVYDNFYICSECGESGYNTFKYCPNCGAKMESEEENG